MNKEWLVIGFCVLLAGLTAFSSVYLRIKTPAEIDGRLPARPRGRGFQIFYQQVIFAALIVTVWIALDLDPFDFGVSQTVGPLVAFGMGFAIYFLILALVELSARLAGVRNKLHDLSFETMRFIWPREGIQKPLAVIAVCLLNPFTEEVIYRGVLIYYLGEKSGSIIAAVVIGLTLSLLAHAYQGVWLLPFQLLFHGTAIALLYSPLGIFGCFGLHFAGDLVPVVLLRKSMLEWRERKRSARAFKKFTGASFKAEHAIDPPAATVSDE